MNKYLALTKMTFQEDLFYRANFFFYFLRQLIWFLIEILLWRIAFQAQASLAGYNYQQIFQYFLIIYLVRVVAVTGVDFALADLIRTGKLSKYLLRPISFFWAIFFHQLGRKLYRLLYLSSFIFILILFGQIEINWLRIFLFSLILINAIFLSFLYRFLLGNLAFWVINISSVLWFFRQTANFLAGGWLPLSFFPQSIELLMRSLPFYLTLGFPAEFFQGRLAFDLVLLRIGQQFFWIFLLFFLVAFLWRQGIRRYEAVGH